MSPLVLRLLRVPVTITAVWVVLVFAVPILMSKYAPYVMRPLGCANSRLPSPQGVEFPAGACFSVADIYGVDFVTLLLQSTFRSLALVFGAAVLALVIGTLLGVVAGLWRRQILASAGIVGVTTLLAAVPAFFVAYFLQIVVIVIGASATGGRLLPVYGFGYDEHLVLPLLSISLPAITYTAQLTATRLTEVLETDFVTAARARGLRQGWILAVHVLPHVRPVLLEGLGSGLRVSVASLPIIEYLFQWRGIGQLALEAIGVHDGPAFIFSAVVLAGLFSTLSAVADLSRPRAIYRLA